MFSHANPLIFTLNMPTMGKVQVRPTLNDRGQFVWRSESRASSSPLSPEHLAITYQVELGSCGTSEVSQ